MATQQARRAAAQRLEELKVRRAKVDAELAERRRREEEALADWARAEIEADEIGEARDTQLAELEVRRREIEQAARAKLDEVDERLRGVLQALRADGRTPAKLSQILGISKARVGGLLRTPAEGHDTSRNANDGSDGEGGRSGTDTGTSTGAGVDAVADEPPGHGDGADERSEQQLSTAGGLPRPAPASDAGRVTEPTAMA